MATNESFISEYQGAVDLFYSIGLEALQWRLDIEGIEVSVSRVSSTSKYSRVYGASYSSNQLNDNEVTTSTLTLLININQINDRWALSQEETVIHYMEVLQRGDIVDFTRGNTAFKYKVSEVKTFTDKPQIYYEFVLTPVKEKKI